MKKFWYPKKTLCVFAHPDDEAFGPGGTIALLAQKGEVEIVCVTDGGSEKDDKELAKQRRGEIERSAKILGVNKVTFWGYGDGSLNNRVYHEIAKKLIIKVQTYKPEVLITFQPNGISGHLDHIALAMITSFVFDKTSEPKELWYFGISDRERKFIKDYFIYFPPGFKDNEVDMKVDVSSVWDKKLQAVDQHQSQIKDINNLKEHWKNRGYVEDWFQIRSKG
jgi:LmbE family N-acetylglucosaminyl deacetylase